MAVTTAAIIGAAATGYGAYQSNQSSRRAASAQDRALQQATTQLNPFAIRGFGGMGAGYGMPAPGLNYGNDMVMPGNNMSPEVASILGRVTRGAQPTGPNAGNHMVNPADIFRGAGPIGGSVNEALINALGSGGGYGGMPGMAANNSINLNAGDLEGVRSALSQFATQGVPGSGNALPANIQQALGMFQQAGGQPVDLGTGGLDVLSSGVNGAFMDAANSLGVNGGGGPMNTAFKGAYDKYYDQTLGTLRQNADVNNQRNFASLQDNLFATGRMGSSGGALQTEAFARGLAQSDAGLQMQAHDMSRGLLNDAFGRFTQSAGIAQDLNTERFARSMYGDQRGYGRAQDWLGTNVSLAGLPSQLQGSQLQNVLSALQGQAGIQQQGLSLFGAGLSAEQAAANARIGAGSNMANIVGSANFGAPAQANAGMWAQLGSSLMDRNGMGGILGGLFNRPQQSSGSGADALNEMFRLFGGGG